MDKITPVLSSTAQPAARAEVPDLPSPSGRTPRGTLRMLLMLYRIELFLFRALETSHRFARQKLDSAVGVFGGLAREALTTEEKNALTVGMYNIYPDYFKVGNELYEWEEPWVARLPPPPSRVLVGACGTGREAVALATRGYCVDAIEPAPDFAAESQRRLGDRGRVYRATYEQVSALLLDGSPDPHPLKEAHYDAVILGNGSLSHVLDPREQQRILGAASKLCPHGPILASFLCDADEGAPRPGRAGRFGRRIGRFVARLRRLPPLPEDQRLTFRSHAGFDHVYTPFEIERLGQGIGREVVWEGNKPSNHATFPQPRS